ncbi:MAG: hypothetical protein IIA41_13050 [SAR324 cluster bacterium]|nr:hypothetical protein [SAR324 cluster bacterium]
MNPRIEDDIPPRRAARRASGFPWHLPVGLLLTLAALALPAALAWQGVPGGTALAEPNVFERESIEQEALDAFRRMITLWREELYFELYEEGWAASRERVSLESFAERMVELAWLPQGELDDKFLKPDFRHRTMVYIQARLAFQHKFDPTQRFEKDHSALLLKENGRWRIDLVQLVRSPYS